MLQVNGDKYIGAWKNDLMHGIGIFYDAKEEAKKLNNYSVFEQSYKHYHSMMEFDEAKILHYLTKDVKRTKKQMKRLETFKEMKI